MAQWVAAYRVCQGLPLSVVALVALDTPLDTLQQLAEVRALLRNCNTPQRRGMAASCNMGLQTCQPGQLRCMCPTDDAC